MVDIDLLVLPQDEAELLRLLDGAGFSRLPDPPGRPLSFASLAERQLVWRSAGAAQLLEVHTSLDKLIGRPFSYAEVFQRGQAVPTTPGILLPCPEDHALLVVLHAAGAEFRHEATWTDLELLLKSGLDLAVFEERARSWRLQTAAYIALETLRVLGSTSVPSDLLERLCPTQLRLRALASCYRVGHYPVTTGQLRLGLPWVLRQTPLRDDLLRWLAGVTVYAAKRGVERSLGLGSATSRGTT